MKQKAHLDEREPICACFHNKQQERSKQPHNIRQREDTLQRFPLLFLECSSEDNCTYRLYLANRCDELTTEMNLENIPTLNDCLKKW